MRLHGLWIPDFHVISVCELWVLRLFFSVIKTFSLTCSFRSKVFSFQFFFLVGKFQFCLFMLLCGF